MAFSAAAAKVGLRIIQILFVQSYNIFMRFRKATKELENGTSKHIDMSYGETFCHSPTYIFEMVGYRGSLQTTA